MERLHILSNDNEHTLKSRATESSEGKREIIVPIINPYVLEQRTLFILHSISQVTC